MVQEEDNRFDGLPLGETLVRFAQKVDIGSRQFPNEIPPVIVEVNFTT